MKMERKEFYTLMQKKTTEKLNAKKNLVFYLHSWTKRTSGFAFLKSIPLIINVI